MQKKIIALAVAGLMSGAAFAQSNVTIYGVMHASYDRIDTDETNQDTLKRFSSNFSRIGFKGTEALGNGLAANWQIEQQVNIDNGLCTNAAGSATSSCAGSTSAFGGGALRNTWVGLSSKTLGEFRVGTHDTAYKTSTRGLDIFGDTIADNSSIFGTFDGGSASAFDPRNGSSINYLSPVFNGFQVTGNYFLNNESGNLGKTNPNQWSLAATYANGPLFVALAHERHNYSDVTAAALSGAVCRDTVTGAVEACGADATQVQTSLATAPVTAANDWHAAGTRIGAGYTFMGTTKVGFLYERLSASRDGSDSIDRNAWGVNLKHTMGNIDLKAAYTRAGDSDQNNVNDGAKNWALGADYNMSKRTQVYALYTKTSNDTNGNYGLGRGNYSTTTGGKDPSAISFGLKHSF